jgi:hypothetical protein
MEMITLNTKQQIILLWHQGHSKSEIAQRVNRNRDTVRKYITEYEKKKGLLHMCDNPDDIPQLIDDIVETPKYDASTRPKRKLTEDIVTEIETYLEENRKKRQRGEGKQLKKKIDIYEALANKGFDIGYTTVCNVVNEIEGKGAEAYIKGLYDPGHTCEFDWGEVKLEIDEQKCKLQLAVFTAAYSNYRYAVLFINQKTECFQEAHARFFDSINGSYGQMVYDNMKVAVKKFVGLSEKEPTEALLQLSIYYGFAFRFCGIRKGNEKGHVERSVEYIRRKAFSGRTSFNSVEEANCYLQEVCNRLNQKEQQLTGKSALELFEDEKCCLRTHLPTFDAARITHAKADKYSCVTFDQNHYSVPDRYVGKMLKIKAYSTRIICFYNYEKVASHSRKHGPHEWSIELDHYLNTLKRKPGALPNSVAMAQAHTQIKNLYTKYYSRREKDFVELLLYLREKTIDAVESAIERLHDSGVIEITTDKIKFLCNQSENPKQDYTATQSEEISSRSNDLLEALGRLIPSSSNIETKEAQIH